tara:strand:- start:113 stop:391 length:279 start_codon:yes stop_codon:yes gene_type:complete
MEALQSTALIGLAILATNYLITIVLMYRWLQVSRQAVVMALDEKNVSDKQLDKMLKKLRFYSSLVGASKQLTMEVPLLGSILVGVLIITVVF